MVTYERNRIFAGALEKRRFDLEADRIGPDIPFTHWRLFLKPLMERLCQKKFKHFGIGAEMRPYAFAINCSKISVGDHVVVRPGTMLFAADRGSPAGNIVLGDQALIGSGVHIYTANHRFGTPNTPVYGQGHFDAKDTELAPGCWVGANAVLLPGIRIGENSVVGAGSIVTSSVPPNVVVAGNPARVVKTLE